jgi:hypothetical protein
MDAIAHKENDINILKQFNPKRIKLKMSVKAYMDSRRHLIPWFSCPQSQKLPALGSTSHLKSVSVSSSRLNLHHQHHHQQQHQDSSRSSSTAAPTPVSACFPVLNNNNNNASNINNNVLDSSPSLQRHDPHGHRLPLTPAGKLPSVCVRSLVRILYSSHVSVRHFQFKHTWSIKWNLSG